MRVFRIERQKYLSEVLSGRGAALSEGNRWNSLHIPMVYSSGSRSLAFLEVLAHLDLYSDMPSDRLLVEIDISDTIPIQVFDPVNLANGWDSFPPGSTTQKVGDAFIRARQQAILQVPSSLVEGEFNYLFNPMHPNAEAIQVVSAKALNFNRWRK